MTPTGSTHLSESSERGRALHVSTSALRRSTPDRNPTEIPLTGIILITKLDECSIMRQEVRAKKLKKGLYFFQIIISSGAVNHIQ